MKTVKLNTHQKSYYKDDIIISQKDFPDIEIGDVLEIYSPEDNYSRLLLQVTTIQDKPKLNPSISIEQSIANAFQLRNFSDVIVNVVDANSVLLDSVELFFKDQYLARSDMWRLKKHITNTSVYLNKKIEFSNIRCQVFEMWSQGARMASGYINQETKVVFRSASSMVYLFLQMSSEMWDYDINGDLYFEKAVKGFLNDLFNKWKTFNCSHDVTIVFFSRTFYEATNINEFPESIQQCLQQDAKGRFYEDYYRVVFQNDRYEDWMPTLIYLRKLFNLYEEDVIHYHENKGLKVPRAYNSTASQGNFLEVLNMSLNVFERHNLDRSFDRTGQLSVVISPGVGVYEVDLDLTNITKQRIIDNGIGSDLVCLGEQPLHAVPLFKFNSRFQNMPHDEYNMPHWINLSFYCSKQRFSSNFIPRIKMPNILQTNINSIPKRSSLNIPSFISDNFQICNIASNSGIDLKTCRYPYSIPSFIDFDEYDNQIFKTSSQLNQHTIQPSQIKRNANIRQLKLLNQLNNNLSNQPIIRRRFSEVIPVWSEYNNITPPNSPVNTDVVDGISILSDKNQSFPQLSTSVENKSVKDFKIRIESKDDIIVHNSKSEIHRTKALINPFDPSHVTIKLNSNRRRWTHVFPLGPTGIFMQQHHYQAIPQNTACTMLPYIVSDYFQSDSNFMPNFKRNSYDQVDYPVVNKADQKEKDLFHKRNYNRQSLDSGSKKSSLIDQIDYHQKQRSLILTDNSSLWAWGATGEQEWTPAITTGVDWKSLVMPACLPITTDFLPDKRTLQQDYVTYVYDLLPEDQINDFSQQKFVKTAEETKKEATLTTDRVYLELICQRLQQGFQIILLSNSAKLYNFADKTDVYILSIGRIYHELSLKDKKITIINYHPRHQYKANNIRYCYRIRTPDNETYGVSWVDFTSEKLETYKWNYVDNYICFRGDSEYPLNETLKFWRFRLLVLPTMQSTTKKIIDKYHSGEDDFQCDLYHPFTFEEKIQLQEGFLKLIDTINRIKRPIIKQACRSDQGKNILNRRYSSTSINFHASNSTDNSSNVYNRHSQPDTMLNVINENQTNLEKTDESKNLSNKLFDSDGQPHSNIESKRVSINSPHSEIIDYFKSANNLFIKSNDLPAYTFISSEAIGWFVKNVDMIYSEANVEILFQSLVMNDLIRHASGDINQQFKRGYYLYCIMDKNNEDFFERRRIDYKEFERKWVEVGVVQQHHCLKDYDHWYENSSELIANNCRIDTTEFTFKNILYDLNNGSKTGRVEWINLKYHSLYDPEQAFEMIIEWMVATGNAIPDIVTTWGRTKNTGLHIVPIPWDPFALPFSSRSDPLRGPIYISLNIDCLSSNASLLEGELLFNFQEKILVKFGFIPFHDPSTDNQRQFVHVSGSIFVLLPNKYPTTSPIKNVNKRGKFLKSSEHELACSPHEEYITRHFSGMQQKGQDAHIDAKIGFLWCWNYMITKRWKTHVTGDENSMRKIMQDFRGFCSNKNNRMTDFWEAYQKKMQSEESCDSNRDIN